MLLVRFVLLVGSCTDISAAALMSTECPPPTYLTFPHKIHQVLSNSRVTTWTSSFVVKLFPLKLRVHKLGCVISSIKKQFVFTELKWVRFNPSGFPLILLWNMRALGKDLDFPALAMTINCRTELVKEPDFYLRSVLQIQQIP